MINSLKRLRFAMLGLTVVYFVAFACGVLVVGKEVIVAESAATTGDEIVHKADWPAGVINNIVRMNFFTREPEHVLLLSFSNYDDLEGRGIDHFLQNPSQADLPKASLD